MTMMGGSVTGNTAANLYGGIDVDGTLIMSGNPIVMGNTVNGNSENVRLPEGKVITVNRAFTSGATVGVTLASVTDIFTSGYGNHTHEQGMVFASDNIDYSVVIANGEAKLQSYSPTGLSGTIQYLNVDATGEPGLADCSIYTKMSDVLSNGNFTLSDGWYVVDKNLTFNSRIIISGTVNLILMDNTRLTANNGIYVPSGATLHIWAQSTEEINPNGLMGIINATANDNDYSGIGGKGRGNAGDLRIHGGYVTAIGGKNAAGINGAQCIGFNNHSICIYGGSVIGMGGEYGAGIGGNQWAICSGILITGGNVFGFGGEWGAGIGSGCFGTMHVRSDDYSANPANDELTHIRITGGYVKAVGSFGAGIGGGAYHDTFEGDAAYVVIEGGKVVASTLDPDPAGLQNPLTGAQAIGQGGIYKGVNDITVTTKPVISDAFKVSATDDIHGSPSLVTRSTWDNTDDWGTYKQITIEVCDHPEHNNPITYTNNTQDGNLSVNCPYCHTTEPYTFTTAGNWNVQNNWLGSIMPGAGKDVAVKAAATIPSNCCAHVGHIDMQEGGSLTIADGGQLIHSNTGVVATVQKHIAARSTVEGVNKGWAFIASPVTTDLTPSSDNHITDNNYDLYRFNQSAALEWENYKAHSTIDFMTLENGRGYLYNNSVAVDLAFNGVLRPATADTMALVYDATAEFVGWNLVGNPFAFNAYVNQSYYTMDADGTAILPTEQTGGTVAPCTGIMVKATGSGQKVVFSNEPMTTAPSNGSLNITVSQSVPGLANRGASTLLDKAIVSFNEGNELGKFYFGEQNANIYIPQGGEEYAIVSVGRDAARHVSTEVNEIPVNFKAKENGTYTLTVNPEGVEMAYLHLIDNMTGADVDLVPLLRGQGGLTQPASYTFNAKTSDYASRFRLVFVCGDANDDNDGDNAFAFISNGNIIVDGEGTLQVMDVTGRVIVCTDVARNVSTQGMTQGVYVLRLVNGDNVRTQKMVID